MTAELHVAKTSDLSQEVVHVTAAVDTDQKTINSGVEDSKPNHHESDSIPNEEKVVGSNAPSALEQLAKNLDNMTNYKTLQNNVNLNDIVAFKVFMPSFELSEYIIGMVEAVENKNAMNDGDFELTLLIMGKWALSVCFLFIKYIIWQNLTCNLFLF